MSHEYFLPLFFIQIFIQHRSFCNFLDLYSSHLIRFKNRCLGKQKFLCISKMVLTLFFLCLKLFHKFLIYFGGSVSVLSHSCSLFKKYFQLLFKMRILLLEIELLLIVKYFIRMMPGNDTFKDIFLILHCRKLQLFLGEFSLKTLKFFLSFIFITIETVEFQQISLLLFLKLINELLLNERWLFPKYKTFF